METQAIKSLAKNSLWLAIGEIINGALMFFLTIFLARYLMAEGYGKLTFALSLVNILAIFSDLGLSMLTTRELAQGKNNVKKYISNVFVIKVILAIITLILVYLVVNILNTNSEVSNLIYLLGVWIILHSFIQFIASIFRAFEKMMYEAFIRISHAIILFLAIFACIFLNYDIVYIGMSYCLAGIISFLIAVSFIWFKFSHFSFGFDIAFWKKILNKSWPFALSIFFTLIYYYMDSIMLELMGKYEEVGWYNAAYRPIMFIIILGSVMCRSSFPIVSRYYKESLKKLQKFLNNYTKLTIFIALPLGFGGTILAYPIINLIYGNDFNKAILAFQILIWTAVTIYINTTFSHALQASDRQKTHLLGVGLGAFINIVLNFILIPKYSLYGAAVATLITEVFVLFFMYYKFSKVVKITFFSKLLKPLIASLIMYIVLYFFQGINVFVLVLVGMIVYFTALILIRGITYRDVLLFKKILVKD
jgi:O-antigen/teichoic acid export membrane protein